MSHEDKCTENVPTVATTCRIMTPALQVCRKTGSSSFQNSFARGFVDSGDISVASYEFVLSYPTSSFESPLSIKKCKLYNIWPDCWQSSATQTWVTTSQATFTASLSCPEERSENVPTTAVNEHGWPRDPTLQWHFTISQFLSLGECKFPSLQLKPT